MTQGLGELAGAVLVRRYHLIRKLGEGGMGVVYEAADGAESGARRAVKILKSEFLYNTLVVQRFLEEARTGQRLTHPNVIRVFDVQVAEDQTPFMVMELLDGAPLSASMSRGQRFPLAQAGNLLLGILAGLSAAHAAGIVHRDLKPENVYVTHSGVPKILDFGIAKVMDVAGGMGSRTQTGMLLGTPAYMSPEQIRNSKDVDARSDLFAAGGLLYELLAGHQAFTAANEFAKLTAVLTMEPEPIERVDPELARVGPFLARALAKDRNLRFQSADEMAAALSAVLGAAGAAGHGPSAAPSRIPGTQPVVAVPMAPAALIEVVSVVPDARASATPPEAPNRFVPSAAPPAHATTPPASGGNNTLASPRSMTVHEPAPVVVVESARGGRLVPAWVVAILVAAALFFGFILGFGAAQSR